MYLILFASGKANPIPKPFEPIEHEYLGFFKKKSPGWGNSAPFYGNRKAPHNQNYFSNERFDTINLT